MATFFVTTFDETWGVAEELSTSRPRNNYADAKALACMAADVIVKEIREHNWPVRSRVLPGELGLHYEVCIEWCADGVLLPEDWNETFPGYGYPDAGLQRCVVVSARIYRSPKVES